MPMFLFLVFVAVIIAFVLTRKSNQPLKPLVGNVKKVEAAVVKAAEVATNALDVNGDGKVDLKGSSRSSKEGS
jgi:nitrogen fixation/metabolism regulation signal transduction histidine kinase